MIHSLFLINCSGDIFLEKHWKSVVSQSVCDYFFEAQEKAADVENVPPVISTPHHYLISIYRDKLFFVSVIQTEVPPLFVIEFLGVTVVADRNRAPKYSLMSNSTRKKFRGNRYPELFSCLTYG